MSDIILRVKRKRDEKPADIIEIESKKIKSESVDEMLSNLSLNPTRLVFKLQKDSFEKRAENFLKPNQAGTVLENIKTNYIANHRERAKLERLQKAINFRIDKTIEGEMMDGVVYCNGKAMKLLNPNPDEIYEDYEYDWYKIEEVGTENRSYQEGILYLNSDGESPQFSEESDSEDSNRENHPYHDYPEEEDESYGGESSEEEASDKSIEYEYELSD
ncbi:unnamed protein product [Blepharisma stoltei]|uniref:RNA polymerase II nuclear localization protein SLC7A6OS n=1 Tax=Blepharisma stoltei TaxID=1481888 RepID=A0AAU9IQ08_9CILI|nr:unnamed protein product [Blepharisma stoltei]